MTVLLLALVALVVTSALVALDVSLDDPAGLGRREPPRSHPPELFDPRARTR